jgi:hypothetical protein
MSASVEQITDYKIFNASPWLIEFFKAKNILGILESADNQFNELEQVFYDMFTKLWIDYAEGYQLDVLGIHVSADRNGLNDTDYRLLIEAKVQINISSGQPERLISAVRFLYDTNDIEYTPIYPAKVGIYVVDQEYTTPEALLLLQIVPSGVGLVLSEKLVTEADEDFITEDGIQLLADTFYS